jgi:hypothetical protein
MTHILAIDPGLCSGWAILHPLGFLSGEIDGGYIPLVDETNEKLDMFDLVVVEEYVVDSGTSKKTRSYEAFYAIGTLQWLCHVNNIPFVISPRTAKSFDKNGDKLKRLGWWRPGHGGHANDAARHLLSEAIKLPEYRQTLLEKLVDPTYNKRRIARED